MDPTRPAPGQIVQYILAPADGGNNVGQPRPAMVVLNEMVSRTHWVDLCVFGARPDDFGTNPFGLVVPSKAVQSVHNADGTTPGTFSFYPYLLQVA